MPALALAALAGCTAILGIPADLERGGPDSGTDTANPFQEGGDDQLAPDSGIDGDATITPDAPPPPTCDPSKEFAAPVVVASVSTAGQEGSPRLTDDELTMYFDAQRNGDPYFDLYVTKRAKITDPFGSFAPVAGGVNTPGNYEFAPNISSDGRSLFFERQDPFSQNDDFYVATRNDNVSPFGLAAPISGVNTPLYDGKLDVRGNGDELYFVKQGAQTSLDIHVAKRVAGAYVTTQLAVVNSTADEYAPIISPNGLVLYFSSQRPFAAGRTDENIWVATRAKTTDDFGLPTQVLNVNSTEADEPSWISNDRCRLYMISDRPGGPGMQDIYVATRPK